MLHHAIMNKTSVTHSNLTLLVLVLRFSLVHANTRMLPVVAPVCSQQTSSCNLFLHKFNSLFQLMALMHMSYLMEVEVLGAPGTLLPREL